MPCVRYCNRPFSSIDEMNERLINNWNEKISPEDTTYILGDFAFSGSRKIFPRLNGHKILVIGDHDQDSLNQARNLFDDMAPLFNLMLDHDGLDELNHPYAHYIPVTLCHWCMRVWRKSHFNAWHLYGHSHGTLPPIGKSWDVGVDNNYYYPVSLNEIYKIMDTRPDNPNKVS